MNLIWEFLLKISTPAHFAAIFKSWYDTDDGPQEYVVSASVPLGPLLWNIMYNNVLNLPVPEEATVMGDTDYIALVVVAKDIEDAESYSWQPISAVKGWLESSGLTFAERNRRRSPSPSAVKEIMPHTSKPTIKYLGVMIRGKLSYIQHVQYTYDIASTVSVPLVRMVSNVGRPWHVSRLLIASVVSSILLYAAPL